ncbi:hypothetical protein [Chryseobacterium sp.]|uniref:hypothetical protein n=1 Tax=Chryseobacterium sp. TaxID=1871047 RepID=UPI00289FDF95|nr:hypothetical protein [Chryseobacterium sp.]
MRKLPIFILLLGVKNFAQDINYTPPSPEAFKFVNDIKLDEDNTGAANAVLQLLTLKNRSLSESVNITYHTAGIKVDDLPTDIGMAWGVKVGGIITRTVYGQADELANERLNYDESTIRDYLASDCSPNDLMRRVVLQSTTTDAQKDIYRFNVNGLSGSFILDENFKPKFLQNEANVRINMLFNGSAPATNYIFNGFELTATNGTRYLFGGTNFIEQSGATTGHPPFFVPTGYYLNKVIAINGDSLDYTYSNEDLVSNKILRIDSYTNVEGITQPITIAPQVFSRNDIQRLVVKNKKRLIQITGGDYSFVFNYLEKANSDYEKYLESIDYKFNNQIAEKIKFEYLFEDKQPSQRFFLTQVKLFKKDILDKAYSFEYDNPEKLPNRLANSQDMLGFFNDANNPTLLPLPYHPFFKESAYGDLHFYITPLNFGNRKPNFEKSLYGSLKKIIYPTGGSTEYTYEAPKAHDLDELNIGVPPINTFDNLTYNEVIIPTVAVTQSPEVTLKGGIMVTTTPRYAIFRMYEYDASTGINGTLVLEKEVMTYKRPNVPVPSITFNLPLQEGKSYKLTYTFKQNYTEDIFFTGALEPIKVKAFRDYLGLRVKSKTDIAENNQKVYKRYYYRPAEFYNKEELYTTDKFFIEPDRTDSFTYSGSTSAGDLQTITYSSSNTSPYYEVKNKNRYSVISYSLGGDNFENGGYEKHFKIDSDDPLERIKPAYAPGPDGGTPSSGLYFNDSIDGKLSLIGYVYNNVYFPPLSNRTDFDGQLIKTKYYEKKNNAIYKIKQDINDYLYDNNNEYSNLKISPILNDVTPAVCNGQALVRIGTYYIGLYKWVNVVNKIINSKSIEYKNPVLLNQSLASLIEYNNQETLDALNTQGLETEKKFFYDLANNYLLKEDRNISTTGETINTHYLYPIDKGNQYLINKNFIDTPLEIKTVKKQSENTANEKTISKIETIYPVNDQEAKLKTKGLPLPYMIKKGDLFSNSMDPEISYKYDDKGNVVEYVMKPNVDGEGGVPVALIWGYDQTLPIAKVEGITYHLLSGAISDFPALLLASDHDANPLKFNMQPEVTEAELINKLNELRKNIRLKDYLITTYTYDPLTGVRSITPPSGIREEYIYDSMNRLEKVKDINGKILKEYKYNYKH